MFLFTCIRITCMLQRSLVAKVQRRQLPDVGMLFFNLTVRRDRLVSDSLNEVKKKKTVYSLSPAEKCYYVLQLIFF